MTIEVGRLVVKIAGRDAGCKGVIVSVLGGQRVLVTGPKTLSGLRRKPVNVRHIIPLPHKIDIAKDSTDEEILKALEAKGLAEYVKRKAEVARW